VVDIPETTLTAQEPPEPMPSRGDLPSWEDFGKLADETDVLSDVLNAIGNVLKWIPPFSLTGCTYPPEEEAKGETTPPKPGDWDFVGPVVPEMGAMVEEEETVEEVEENKPEEMTTSNEGVDMIAEFELSPGTMWARGLGEYDSQGKPIGIYPHYVFKKENNRFISDGGITFGYGHHITQDSYNKNENNAKAIVDKYAPGALFIPSQILSNGSSYRVPGSSYMPMDEVKALLERDLKKAEDKLNEFLDKHKLKLNQHQFDAMVSFLHNYGIYWLEREDKEVMRTFLSGGKGFDDPQKVMDVFMEHDIKSRRKEEAKLFSSGKYPS